MSKSKKKKTVRDILPEETPLAIAIVRLRIWSMRGQIIAGINMLKVDDTKTNPFSAYLEGLKEQLDALEGAIDIIK